MRLATIYSTALLGASFVSAVPAKPRAVGDLIPVDMIGMVNKYKTHIDTALTKKDGNKSNKVCKHSTVSVRKEW
jgi:tyrosinase